MNSTTAWPRGSNVPLRCLRKIMFFGEGTGGGTGELEDEEEKEGNDSDFAEICSAFVSFSEVGESLVS